MASPPSDPSGSQPPAPAGPPSRPTVPELARDLAAEHRSLDELVSRRPESDWGLPTPSLGWTVADQIGHLTYFDRTATRAIVDPEAFEAEVAAMMEALARGEDPMASTLLEFRAIEPDELLGRWRAARGDLFVATGALEETTRLPWYGPPMGAVSFLTARLMETWAHGQDVADALGVHREPTDRLRHIAQLGVITRRWSYTVRGEVAPSEPVCVRLLSPSGAIWEWDGGAAASIEGPAVDFCLVVTQRRNVADTGLEVVGKAAVSWMQVAQAFAGGPTRGPELGRAGATTTS